MSTSAKIQLPTTSREFYVSSDGYPDTMETYIQDIIETAKNNARRKYKNPKAHWEEELERLFNKKTEGMYSELSVYNNSFVEYVYTISPKGEISVTES